MIGKLIHHENPHVVCLNETKLTIPVYLDNYWSHQTLLQRKWRKLGSSNKQSEVERW